MLKAHGGVIGRVLVLPIAGLLSFGDMPTITIRTRCRSYPSLYLLPGLAVPCLIGGRDVAQNILVASFEICVVSRTLLPLVVQVHASLQSL